MASVSELEQLVDLLVRAQEASERTGSLQVKLLIELAMYELGTSIARQRPIDEGVIKTGLDRPSVR